MIEVFDRQRGEKFTEQVFGGRFVSWAYETPLGRRVMGEPFIQRALSRVVGYYQGTTHSTRSIEKFIETFKIPMEEFQVPSGGFRSFNDFFIREFQIGARAFPQKPQDLGAMAEGRLSVFPLNSESCPLVIKGQALSLAQLLGSPLMARKYVGGHAFVFRLCPVDYHRFHFPDSGTAAPPVFLGRMLHSVNPAAHQVLPDIFLQNERQVTRFQSDHFGDMLLIEVGATCVGRITQTFTARERVERGQEKGYFSFGGSTTLMLTQGTLVKPAADLLAQTEAGVEVLVRLGEVIASSATS